MSGLFGAEQCCQQSVRPEFL